MTKEKNKKPFLIASISVVVLVIAVVVAVVLHKKDVYRLITLDSMEGVVELTREGKLVESFKGMHLKSGDRVSTGEESYALLLADKDKHILAEENTGFSIAATGTEEKGGITIHLDYGSALITIDNKLKNGSSFEVETPNATLSVRGTVFHVTYDKDLMCTMVDILEGTVEITTETNSFLGNAGETYYVDEQGLIESGEPTQDTEDSGEVGTEDNNQDGTGNSNQIGTDIEPLPEEGLISPITITQAEFESQYVEEIIELTPANSSLYFEVIEKDGVYLFVLKPGYTGYGDGYTVELSDGDSATVSTGASRYIFQSDTPGTFTGDWIANGTIVKYSIPDDMWCQAGDKYIFLLEMNDGRLFSIER